MYLVSPIFAKQGYIQLPEYGFKLTEDFDDLDEKERTIRIITTIPFNLTSMFCNDLFSSKLAPVYINQLKEEHNRINRHFIATFLIFKQPDGWREAIISYISSLGKDSYYLGTIIDLMVHILYSGNMEDSDKRIMQFLLKTAMFKSETG